VKTKEHEKTDQDEWYQRVEKEAYANLFDYIRTGIFHSKKIVLVTSLTMKLESFMLSGGVELLRDSTRKHIHRTLKSELGDSVHLFPDDKGKLLMVPDSVSLQDVVLENQSLRRELEIWKAKVTDFNKIIDQTSSQIRSAIKEDMVPTPWPYHPSDVNSSAIPSQLERLLVGLLTGEPDCVKSAAHRVTHSCPVFRPGYYICSYMWETQTTKTPTAPICSQNPDWKH
jgi:hypothetical protein